MRDFLTARLRALERRMLGKESNAGARWTRADIPLARDDNICSGLQGIEAAALMRTYRLAVVGQFEF
jgi:hypothetical protein